MGKQKLGLTALLSLLLVSAFKSCCIHSYPKGYDLNSSKYSSWPPQKLELLLKYGGMMLWVLCTWHVWDRRKETDELARACEHCWETRTPFRKLQFLFRWIGADGNVLDVFTDESPKKGETPSKRLSWDKHWKHLRHPQRWIPKWPEILKMWQ